MTVHSDGWGEKLRFFDSAASHLALTRPVRAFLDEAGRARCRSVIRTRHDAHLSWFVADEMRRRRVRWLVLGADGLDYDARSGLPVEAPPGSRAARLPVEDAPLPRCPALTFDVKIRDSASHGTTCGRVAEFMVAALGGGQLTVMDTVEPLGQPWSTSGLTSRLRSEMPLSRRHLARATGGAVASIQVKRTRQGIAEHSRGVVPLTGLERIDPALAHVAEEALVGLNSRFRVTMATATVTTVEMSKGRPGVSARPRLPELPMAVLIGPALLSSLGLDLDDARKRFNATTVGPTKVPALYLPLADDPGRYQRFAEHVDGEVFRDVLREAVEWDAPEEKGWGA
ncbi:DUF6177 family protein [Arachnia propionica]|uniref:Uncharacterized protein n=1 Tax=Arachnia propionica TaxID=1750 RepID=A0A3P1WRA4_9ACTN|nr:DUF6177 family protein [Arachnia propionica]RRD48486.1 hypothetical protein EII35_12480 [Arachnia propionica]